jgi:hypothetical protein
VKKMLALLVLGATLAACNTGTKPAALVATTLAPEVTSAAPSPVPVAHLLATAPKPKAVVTASPKPSPRAIPRTTSPRPRVIATRAAAPPATEFANCTAMHERYPHGVGRPGAVDHTSGTPVTSFYVSASLYDANTKSDRDKDGIACES